MKIKLKQMQSSEFHNYFPVLILPLFNGIK